MKKIIAFSVMALVLLFGSFHAADAALQDVAPNNFITADGLDTGYPLWYQDFNDLKLELCNLNNGLCLLAPPLNPLIGVGEETFWWAGETSMTFTGGDALLVLAMEGAFGGGPPVPGDQVSFGRIRIRINGLAAGGVYTITHPFRTMDLTADAAGGINFTEDIGCLAAPCDFRLALSSGIGPFLFWDTGLPILDPAGIAGDNFYIGDAATPHKVLGSPTGNNVFRIERDGILIAETDLFIVVGKVFTGDGNTAPTTVPESVAIAANPVGATDLNTVTIPVLANDTALNIPINPGSLAIVTQPTKGTAAIALVNGQKVVTYTPNPGGATGDDSFTYTVQNFAGTVSTPATVNIVIEDLQATRAVFRPKLMKWQVEGTSSDTVGNTISARISAGQQTTDLTGAQVVPPVTTTATGNATVTPDAAQTQISFNLSYANLLNITGASIRIGGTGATGPAIFTLAPGDFATPRTGTLTAADLIPQAGQGINTFADAVQAILAGNTYVEITTAANPGGAIRGQLGTSKFVGQATVGADGQWMIIGGSPILPDADLTINIQSSNGIGVQGIPVEMR